MVLVGAFSHKGGWVIEWDCDFRLPSCRIFDANGVEYLRVLWLNLWTGELEQYVEDENGQPIIDKQTGELLKRRVVAKVPMRLEFQNTESY